MTLEELQKQFLELKDKYDNLEQSYNDQKSTYEASEIKIRELEQINQKLFVRLTTPAEEKKEEEYISKLLGEEYTKVLDKNEIEFIKQIEEEIE